MNEFEKRINEAKNNKSSFLDLSNKRLSTIPESIIQLTNLQILHLNCTSLTTIPEFIGQLTSLRELMISNNPQLSTISESIGQLTNLNRLGLLCNPQLTTIPKSIVNLTNLKYLNISKNPQLGYPDEILNSTNAQTILEYILTQQRDTEPVYNQISYQTPIPQQTQKQTRRIFISYCWKNSKQAEKNHQVSSCVGLTDPRDITKGIELLLNEKCWLDVDTTNGGHALFSAIQVGINQSEVVVACISDQYVKSDTCEDELTYARKTLKKPVIPIIVGEGMEWQNSWAGLMLAKEVYIDFRDLSQFDSKMDQLIGRLMKILP